MIRVFLYIFSCMPQGAHECSDATSEHFRAPRSVREKMIKITEPYKLAYGGCGPYEKVPMQKVDRFSISHVLQKPDFEIIAILSNVARFFWS